MYPRVRFSRLLPILALLAMAGCDGEDIITPEPAGMVVVHHAPKSLIVGWNLIGPDGYLAEGTADTVLAGLAPGEYAIEWGEQLDWFCPPRQTQAVADGATLIFHGEYSRKPGSISVETEPDHLEGSWSLTGPDSVVHGGRGDRIFPGMAGGEYVLVWDRVIGWIEPAPQTKTLEAPATLTFQGEYRPLPGTITLTVHPDTLDATWVLKGPDSYRHQGRGNLVLSDLVPGDYTVNWGPACHWDPPQDETLTLSPGGEVVFAAVYTTARNVQITLDPNPDTLHAGWELSGPDDFFLAAAGDQVLTGMKDGDYSIVWKPSGGMRTPPAESLILERGARITLAGNYYREGTSLDDILMVFDPTGTGSPLTTCETVKYMSSISIKILWVNPSLPRVGGLECGWDLSGSDPYLTRFTTSYPIWGVDSGESDARAGSYNIRMEYGAPIPTSPQTILAEIEVHLLDGMVPCEPGDHIFMTMRPARPSSLPGDSRPLGFSADHQTLIPLDMVGTDGESSLEFNGECGFEIPKSRTWAGIEKAFH